MKEKPTSSEDLVKVGSRIKVRDRASHESQTKSQSRLHEPDSNPDPDSPASSVRIFPSPGRHQPSPNNLTFYYQVPGTKISSLQ